MSEGTAASRTPISPENRMDEHLWQAGEPLGPVGTEVLFENEQIRVWRVALGPNAHQPWHQHELPYLIVPLTRSHFAMRFADGTVRRFDDTPGAVKWRGDPGPVHELYHLGDGEAATILVEIKDRDAAVASVA